MGCALTEPNNYPDYLKKILKEIEVGNDKELKDCACSLISPRTEDGCLMVDENGKIGAFPDCISDDPPPYNYPSGSLKDIMTFYWRVKKFKVTFSGSGVSGNDGESINMSGTFDLTPNYFNPDNIGQIKSDSELVCSLGRTYYGGGGTFLMRRRNGEEVRTNLYGRIDHLPLYYKQGEKLQTRIEIGGGVGVNYFFRNIQYDNSSEDTGSWTMNFEGGSLSGRLYTPSFAFLSASFNMTFTATEYWP
jgi:hypothetical protein